MNWSQKCNDCLQNELDFSEEWLHDWISIVDYRNGVHKSEVLMLFHLFLFTENWQLLIWLADTESFW